jgi:short-subunit dehydrogenase
MKNQNVLITGAASGIGQATAIELARRGAKLGLADIDREGLAHTRAELARLGAEAHTFVVDLASKEAIEALAKDALAKLGSIDVLINNAGVAVVAPLAEIADSDWEWIFAVNVWAPIRLTRALLPHMTARKSGHIVMTASLAGLIGAPSMLAYSTTKFALVGFSEALRLELSTSNIDVTIVCPGYVKTNLHRATRYANAGFERFLDDPPFWYGLSKERAAKIITDAIAAKDPLVVFGLEKLGWYLKRLSPTAATRLSQFVARRAGLVPRSESS